MRRPSSHAVALSAILLLGVGLRIASVAAPGSLQWDELATARNVELRSWSDILTLRSLDQRQVASLGFLAAEKAGVSLTGQDDLGLRLFPLLVSIAGLFLFWRIASRYLSGAPLLAAIALFAACPALVWYARKAKQYAGDVTLVLVLWWVALRLLEGRLEGRRAWLAGLLGAVAILLSQPAAIVAVGMCAVLLWHYRQQKMSLRPLVHVTAIWAAAAVALSFTTFIQVSSSTRQFMHQGWEFAFFPAPWSAPDAWWWLPWRLFDFVGFFFGMLEPDTAPEIALVAVYCAFAIAGLYRLGRGDRWRYALLLTPLAVAILASILRILPLSGRLMIYVGPAILIAVAAGVEWAWSRSPRRLRPVTGLLALSLALPGLLLPFLIPALARNEDTRPVLEEMRGRWRPGDVVYVHYGAIPAMAVYGGRLGLSPWVRGESHGRDVRSYLAEVDDFRGRERMWFFFTHGGGCTMESVVAYMDAIGTRLERIEDPHGVRGMHRVEAFLYDLSGSDDGVDAASFAIPQVGSGASCRPGVPAQEVIKRRVRRALGSLVR